MPKLDIENPRAGFASLVLNVDGKEFLVKSVSYSDGIDRGQIEGNARMSLGVSEGMYKAEESTLELYLAEYDEVMDAFADEFFNKAFTVTAAFESAGKTRTDTLVGCRWTKRSSDNQSGPDALTRSLSFLPQYIKVNGKNPLKKMPTGAI
ncbi:hypothetical protein E7T06_07300 [Deinococcus sp. Arct2-2]|uniref:hypothetical protein n=1 Tax=Deinococcus sp. Arct2-2 TaxID=2568653 RepID=UPI0010A50883|nr:hypothetical protein [Deinococcus sp. Arct2-2]THF70503.1 hypothetical protein E7T06_07300 [Deinococcus sp. Arct2-2]